jgi:hypothetical protein
VRANERIAWLLAAALCGTATAQESAERDAAEVRCPPEQPARPGRRSPRVPVLRFEPTPCDPTRLPDADPNALDAFPELPDRWRIVNLLGYP